MNDFTTWDIVRNLLLAARWTMLLSVIAFVCGGLAGLLLLFMRTSKSRLLSGFSKMYIEVFQGTPLLMQLFLVFFGVGLIGWQISPLLAVVRKLAEDGMTLIMVTHEMRFAREVSDQLVFMHHGKVHEQGDPRQLFAAPSTPELANFVSSVSF